MNGPVCSDQRRRAAVRAHGHNGIDSVDVGTDRHELTVLFFAPLDEEPTARDFRIEGGVQVSGIRVVGVEPGPSDDPEVVASVRLRVDRVGDISTYRLRVVGLHGFDSRYSSAEFRFVTGCDDLDCAPACQWPPEPEPSVAIDYLAKDYASFRQLLLERMSLIMPEWTERHVPDIGVALVELLAHEGDRLSYRQDAAATEAYLDTARLRASVRRHARLVDYTMHDGCAARAWVCLEVSHDVRLNPADVRFAAGPQIYRPIGSRELSLRRAHNRIELWTWGDHECCLPTGATSATLVDGRRSGADGGPRRRLRLAPGDVLIFEELVGPKTGLAADADRGHRQAVRLTSVTETMDRIYDVALLEVSWARDDALRFPLCINSIGGPHCTDLTVAVARGNVVLVEHGGTTVTERPEVPVAEPDEPGCPDTPCFGCADVTNPAHRPHYPPLPIRFRPRLEHRPVTQAAPFPAPAVVAAEQARWLHALPERVRVRLRALRDKAMHDELGEGDIAYLTTIFGARTLRRVHLGEAAGPALKLLLARFDDLLASKLARLDHLTFRARGGYLLTADSEGWEIREQWGEAEGAAIDPGNPAFHGAAAAALSVDPRAALPAVTVVDRWGEEWTPRRDLLDSDPDDRHFVGETDDDGYLCLRFGDGRNGAVFEPLERLPRGDEPPTTITYRVGSGRAGNVGAEAIDRLLTDVDGHGITKVRNPIAATGGTGPEPVAQVRMQAPHEARLRQLRAVTAADYAAAAATVPGVRAAAADLRWTGSWYEAQVGVLPFGAAEAPDWLLDEVRAALHRYRRIGHDLAVASAITVALDLGLCVEVAPDHLAGHVRAAVLRVLGRIFDPGGLSFGTPVRLSRIIAAVVAVPGVRSAEFTTAERLFGPSGNALDTGVLPLGPLEVARLDNDPTRPEHGRLRLNLVGGR
ncbi:putative baseplate assembly protein [Nocardia sp. CDC159]|uniref:Baseplate assembly protein n=1 Tax=Nocardia pulmonis TaxID=2951408 RepID=A0A9X2EAI8_9NOCA|nr:MULTISPECIES: putative baseplate assembly protein [Nocardia]MCM6776630.1 putative baseplate assembly protein [Nocardia pulmonis]MCM6789221.1 putative baseplate assembly protein [Nocardia sp. CDC159]